MTLEKRTAGSGVTVIVTGAPAGTLPVETVTAMTDEDLTLITAAVLVLLPALAVTLASTVVDRVVVAKPLSLVSPDAAPTIPAVVVNATGTPKRGLKSLSTTRAVSVTVPPPAATLGAEVVNDTSSTAAAPIRTLSGSALAPPEKAVILAVPDLPSAVSLTVTRPLFVRASKGSILPNDVVKVTSVPLCTGVPADVVVVAAPPPPPVPVLTVPFSIRTAMMSVLPLIGRTLVAEIKVMTVPAGATKGTLSHATWATANRSVTAASVAVRPDQRAWRTEL